MAVQQWFTADKGIRYREHPTRKNGIRPDRYYTLRFYVNGTRTEEALGWGSEGWTLERARIELAKLREAQRVGEGAVSLREAREEAEKERIQKRKTSEAQSLKEILFADFWNEKYLPEAMLTKSSKSIATEIGLYKNWLEKEIGSVPLSILTVELLSPIVQSAIIQKRSSRTVQYILSVVSQIWNMASRYDLVSGKNPATLVKKPKIDNRRMRFLSHNEAKQLLDTLALRSPDSHDVALLSLFAGLRLGEIHSLQWSDIDFENSLITIRDPKNKKNRHSYMTPELSEMLKKRYQGQSKNTHVFLTVNGDTRGFLSKTFERTVRELGMNDSIEDSRQKVVFHTLRHTFASWLVQKGTPLYTVAELMGHSTLDMTKRYAHLAPDNMKAAVMQLSGSLK